MISSWHRASSSSVVTPGATAAPTTCSTSAAARPAARMRSMTSGERTCGPGVRVGTPVSAYGGRGMWSGTGRGGLILPGRTRSVLALWHRLYLRPLPHQQGSLAVGATTVVGLTTTGYRREDRQHP